MDLMWLLAGPLIGALLVWFFLSRLSDRRVAEIERRAQEQLEHAQADALEADRAHNDTKKLLIAAEMTRKSVEERLATSERQSAEDRAKLAAITAELTAAREAASRAPAPALAAGLAEKSRANFTTDGDPAAEEVSAPRAGADASAIETILAAAFLDKGPADDRVHGALSPMAMAREALAREAEALRRGDGAGLPGAPSEPAAGDARASLKRIEAKLAMLPAGSSARAALLAEHARLPTIAGRAVSQPEPSPASVSADPGRTISLAGAVLVAEGGPRQAATAAARIKAIEAKLAMLPAGSSARVALTAERDRLVGATTAAVPAPAAPATRRWTPPALVRELLLATPPADREPDDLKRIKGIGPVLEGKLREFGIYHFEQLAAMTAEEVAKVNAAMDFPGRIERDRWIEQAKDIVASRRA